MPDTRTLAQFYRLERRLRRSGEIAMANAVHALSTAYMIDCLAGSGDSALAMQAESRLSYIKQIEQTVSRSTAQASARTQAG